MATLKTVLTIVFIIVSLVITVVILMQEGKQAGLGAIAGAADTYWGKKAYDFKNTNPTSTQIEIKVKIVASQ